MLLNSLLCELRGDLGEVHYNKYTLTY